MKSIEIERRGYARIDVRQLEQFAVETYRTCPKTKTSFQNANQADDSEFHCIPLNFSKRLADPNGHRNFIVPMQQAGTAKDRSHGNFNILRVTDPDNGTDFWLISSVTSDSGFLLPLDQLPKDLIPSK